MDIITGAYSYTGKYIARLLLAQGGAVKTLTGHPDRPDPFGGRVPAALLDFGNPAGLRAALTGADTLYNTYWIRFAHGGASHDLAVRNTKVLLQAAHEAGVKRIVHVSITGANTASSLPYFRGKGLAEQAVAQSPMSYGIVRPTVVFGQEDILVNNIAWFLRRFPVFPVPGRGAYRVQPVFVEDLARIAVEAGQADGNVAWDAAGPETYSFRDLVNLIGKHVGSRSPVVPTPRPVVQALSWIMSVWLKDVVLTKDEMLGLAAGLLVSKSPARGAAKFSEWVAANRQTLGQSYQSELARHYA